MAEYIDRGITLNALERKKKETEKLVREDTHSIIKDSNNCGRLFGVSDSQKIVYDIPPANVIPIPKGATNGDMIKAMFPNAIDKKVKLTNKVHFMDDFKGELYGIGVISLDWWNAPYQKEAEE